MYNTNITNKNQGRTAETQATLDTRHIQHWTQDTYNIGHKTHITLDTRHIQHWTQNKGKQNKNTTQKTKKMNNTDPTKKLGVNSDAREG